MARHFAGGSFSKTTSILQIFPSSIFQFASQVAGLPGTGFPSPSCNNSTIPQGPKLLVTSPFPLDSSAANVTFSEPSNLRFEKLFDPTPIKLFLTDMLSDV